MEELFNYDRLFDKQNSEIQQKKKKEIEYKLDNSIKTIKGHEVFEIDLSTLKVNDVDYVKRKDILWKDALILIQGGFKKEILVKSNCVYISALNKKNALKRFKENKGSAVIPEGMLKL